MKNLTGNMTINGKDAWTTYFAFLFENKQEDNFSINELMKPLEMKEYTTVDFRERNGEELPDILPSPCYKARDVTLYMAVYGSTLQECNTRRTALMTALRSGWVNLKIKDLPATYKLYYKGVSDARMLTDVVDGTTIAYWKVKFHEPKPAET